MSQQIQDVPDYRIPLLVNINLRRYRGNVEMLMRRLATSSTHRGKHAVVMVNVFWRER